MTCYVKMTNASDIDNNTMADTMCGPQSSFKIVFIHWVTGCTGHTVGWTDRL